MATGAWIQRPERVPAQPPLFLRELIADAPAGTAVLDAGCGPGSWDYALRPDLRITSFDIKYPPGPPARAPHVRIFRGSLEALPLRAGTYDLTICHYVLEHVTRLAPCVDELVRVTKPSGTLYLSVPRAAAFDDRLYRFAGYFAKYALAKFGKRIEHQQRFDFDGLVRAFAGRGMGLVSYARVPAGFSWMNDARTKGLQGPFTDTLAALHRGAGVDLAADANFVMTFRRGANGTPVVRRVTHVCRECGELSVLDPPRPWPRTWTCPYCGKTNPFGRPR
jgi:SAM-dependent methyltransferase